MTTLRPRHEGPVALLRAERFRGAAALLFALVASSGARADTVTLRDGTVHYGTLVRQTAAGVVLDTLVSNIRVQMSFERHRIASVVLDPETTIDKLLAQIDAQKEADQDAGGAAEPAENEAPAPVLKREGHALVLEIPLTGTFGQDIYPKSIKTALDWAVERGVSDIIFRLDSPGGEVWAAERIAELMDERRDRLRFHALIQNAISASIWPTFRCDTITMAPGGTLGGAVVYRMNDTGSAEVDMKMNSIIAAKMAAAAEAHGHSGAVAKAMIIADAEVWGVPAEDGSWDLFESRAEAMARSRDPLEIDSRSTVLTLTSKQAALYGIARELDSDSLDALTRAADLGPWDDAGRTGHELSAEWTARCKAVREEIMGHYADFSTDMQRLEDARTYSNAFAALGSAQRSLKTLQRSLDKATELEMGAITDSFENFDIDRIISDLSKHAGDLRRQRRGG